MRDRTSGLRDVRVALGVVVGMLLAGVVLPLASPERDGASLGIGTTGADATTVTDGTGGSGAAAAGADSETLGGQQAADTATGATGGDRQGPGGGAEGDGEAAGPPGDGDSSGSAERVASDRGITPDTIKIGVALTDLDTVSRTGVGASNGTVEERQRVWEALVAHANEQGGAAGRTIEPAIDSFDALDQSAGPQVCRRLAEDRGVFMIFADVGWTSASALCVTRQYGLPNISYDPLDITTFEQSGGLLWTSMASNDRILYNEAMNLHDRGLLKGKKLGLVTSEGVSQAFDRTQVPTYKSLGYELAHRSDLSQDVSTAQSQIPIEVQQMRSKGVDFIIWAGGPLYSNMWLNQAHRVGYNPTYSFSDFSSGSDDFTVQAVSEQTDIYAWGSRRKMERRTDRSPAESDAACVARAEKATGLSMRRDRDLYWETTRYCGHLSAFVDAANAAGPNPTRKTFAAAMSSLGPRPDLDVGPSDVGGSWSQGKPDGADHLHLLRHDVSCRCWRPEGDWFRMRPLGG